MAFYTFYNMKSCFMLLMHCYERLQRRYLDILYPCSHKTMFVSKDDSIPKTVQVDLIRNNFKKQYSEISSKMMKSFLRSSHYSSVHFNQRNFQFKNYHVHSSSSNKIKRDSTDLVQVNEIDKGGKKEKGNYFLLIVQIIYLLSNFYCTFLKFRPSSSDALAIQ